MQFEITDEAAIAFSDRLYTALAQGLPVDAALAQARRAIVAAGKETEFATPVLFLRAADARLFDVEPSDLRPGTSGEDDGDASGATDLGDPPEERGDLATPPLASTTPEVQRLADWGTGTVQLVHVEHPRYGVLGRGDRRLSGVAFSPDGRYFATASLDRTARVWELPDGRQVAHVAHEGGVSGVAFSPDGRCFATASVDARVWELPGGRQVAHVAHEGGAVAFSPDGRYLATASWDKTARVWDLPGGAQLAQVVAHEGEVVAVALSPDGRYLATASWDKTARLWQFPGGRQVAHVAHEGFVTGVAFSPDGRYLATASQDKTARVWEVPGGRQIARVAHEGLVEGVAFSPDGRYLATASRDNTARVWGPHS